MIGIRVVAARGALLDPAPWLSEGDVEAHGGRGFVETSDDPSEALRFDSMSEALEFWKRQSVTLPLRPDGKPNRPLTALTISPEEIPA